MVKSTVEKEVGCAPMAGRVEEDCLSVDMLDGFWPSTTSVVGGGASDCPDGPSNGTSWEVELAGSADLVAMFGFSPAFLLSLTVVEEEYDGEFELRIGD